MQAHGGNGLACLTTTQPVSSGLDAASNHILANDVFFSSRHVSICDLTENQWSELEPCFYNVQTFKHRHYSTQRLLKRILRLS